MKNKKGLFGGILKLLGFIFLLILIIIGLAVYFIFFKSDDKSRFPGAVIENPMKNIVLNNTDSSGRVNIENVIEQGVISFNVDYINYLLLALGVNGLHKSYVGYGNPIVEMDIENEVWNSEVLDGMLKTNKASIDNEDLKISLSKEEAVKALLSNNIRDYMKNSVVNGNTRIEMVAGKVELASKGYLDMYKQLTGKEADIKE